MPKAELNAAATWAALNPNRFAQKPETVRSFISGLKPALEKYK